MTNNYPGYVKLTEQCTGRAPLGIPKTLGTSCLCHDPYSNSQVPSYSLFQEVEPSPSTSEKIGLIDFQQFRWLLPRDSDAVWFQRLKHRRHCVCPLSYTYLACSGRSQPPHCEGTEAAGGQVYTIRSKILGTAPCQPSWRGLSGPPDLRWL